MLVSRSNTLLNIGLKCIKQGKTPRNVQLQTVRNSSEGWFYRAYQAKPSKVSTVAADIFCGIAWWWVLWHFYHDYHMLIGHVKYPDPMDWTDEELGIPPDDAD